LFIQQYRLEANPFAPDRAHPFFASHSVRYSSLKLAQLVEGQIQCLFLSGPPGVGKSLLVEHHLRGNTQIDKCWVPRGLQNASDLLRMLVKSLGPGTIEGSPAELRKILEVYLLHQAGNGQQSIIIADNLETFSPEVVKEIEGLSRLRLRKRPVVQFILATRNADLIETLVAQHEGGYLARAIHYPLAGFTLEETTAYVRTTLKGAGCVWADELFSDEVLMDLQAFTQGVIGDINALCYEALEALATRNAESTQAPRITRALLKEVGARLHLRYDPSACRRQPDREILPDAVHTSEHKELKIEAARLLVSSGGQLVAEIALNQPRMVLGRDQSCDISLNSSFVSRYQNLFMETDDGWVLIDLNSTNGCFVNGRKVVEHRLRDGDLISIGHHQIRFAGTSAEPMDASDSSQTQISMTSAVLRSAI
jgi:type II secretory pathway predicted ATPase ExeA